MDANDYCKNFDYLTCKNKVNEICESYPFLKKIKIGSSCMGRDIDALKIGNFDDYVLFAAAFHGSEHITTNILLMFIEQLCFALSCDSALAGLNARKALGGRGLIFVPRVNPDGCEISIHERSACGALANEISRLCNDDFTHWNANWRGVDINHNFDADWEALHKKEQESGILGPAKTRFGGFSPESEPETRALCEICRKSNIHHTLALHTQGQVIYWNYGDKCPKNSRKMAEIMATASNYALDTPSGLAYGGGFKDWFIKEFDRPGFTVEIGRGENPLDINDSIKLYFEVRELLMLCAIM